MLRYIRKGGEIKHLSLIKFVWKLHDNSFFFKYYVFKYLSLIRLGWKLHWHYISLFFKPLSFFFRFTKLKCPEDICEDTLSLPKDKYSDLQVYNISKLCNNLFSLHLNKQLLGKKVTCNSLHPGSCMSTGIQRHWWLYRAIFFLVRPFTKSLVCIL